MILLDTNVVSALRATHRTPDPHLQAWLGVLPIETAYISAITLLELERGTLRLERRDPPQGTLLRAWLNDEVLPRFANRILPIDTQTALACAALQMTRTLPAMDSLIAATALTHKLPLATRNGRDFADTGVKLIDPWAYRVGTGSGPA